MKVLAVDLGATSGRVVVGRLREGRFTLTEVRRFPNQPKGSGRGRVWDVDGNSTGSSMLRLIEFCNWLWLHAARWDSTSTSER